MRFFEETDRVVVATFLERLHAFAVERARLREIVGRAGPCRTSALRGNRRSDEHEGEAQEKRTQARAGDYRTDGRDFIFSHR